MAGTMTAAAMIQGAAIRVVAGDVDHVLVDITFMRVVEMTIVQVVCMAVVPHGGVRKPDRVGECGPDAWMRSN